MTINETSEMLLEAIKDGYGDLELKLDVNYQVGKIDDLVIVGENTALIVSYPCHIKKEQDND